MHAIRFGLPLFTLVSLGSCGQRSIISAPDGHLDGRLEADVISSDLRQPGFDCTQCKPDEVCDQQLRICRPLAGECAQCKPNEFCNHDGNCTMIMGTPGSCEPRPTNCPSVYAPICGCDGKMYSNGCEAHAAGVSVNTKEECCFKINEQYIALVAAAKKCSMLGGVPVEPCLKVIDNQLACPCPTSVNMSAPELAELTALAQQWTAMTCAVGLTGCPPHSCPAVSGGHCMLTADGSIGVCTDLSY